MLLARPGKETRGYRSTGHPEGKAGGLARMSDVVVEADAQELFNLRFTGRFKPGFNGKRCAGELQRIFGLTAAKAAEMVAGERVLKRGLEKARVRQWVVVLARAGLEIRVEPVKQPVRDASSSMSPRDRRGDSGHSGNPPVLDEKYFDHAIPLPLQRERRSTAYSLGLLGVILLSLIAPIIYFSLLAAVAASLAMFFLYVPEIAASTRGVGGMLALSFPPVLLGILLVFLLKPLFSKYESARMLEITRRDAPGLFALIGVLAKRIGVPRPRQVFVNIDANAMVMPAGGLRSLARGELQLCVGLPLIAGMSGRQVAGVLAHEFGHFTQRLAMFCSYIVNSINAWLANRAYERDSLELWVQRKLNGSMPVAVAVLLWLAQGMIRVVRQVFAGLLKFNVRMTRYMSRQMEYDADRYESRIGGSETFRDASIELRAMAYACGKAHDINRDALEEGRLLEDFPAAALTLRQRFTDADRGFLEKDLQRERATHFDTHPPDADRIRHAEQRGDVPLMEIDFDSRQLLRDFEELCRKATRWEYKLYGLGNFESGITPNEILLQSSEQNDKAYEALTAYFSAALTGPMLGLARSGSTVLDALDWQETVTAIRRELPRMESAVETLRQVEERLKLMGLGKLMERHGVPIQRASFNLPSNDAEDDNVTGNCHRQARDVKTYLGSIEPLFRRRLDFAYEARGLGAELESAVACLQGMQGLEHILEDLETAAWRLEGILGYLDDDPDNGGLIKMRADLQAACYRNMQRLITSLQRVRDSSEENGKAISVAETIARWTRLETGKPLDDAVLEMRRCQQLAYSTRRYYSRLLGQLATTGAAAEIDAGISPLRLA